MHDVLIEACHTYFNRSNYYMPPSAVIPGIVVKQKIEHTLNPYLNIATVHYVDDYNETGGDLRSFASGYGAPISRELLYRGLSPNYEYSQSEAALCSVGFIFKFKDKRFEEDWRSERWYVNSDKGEIDLRFSIKRKGKTISTKYSCALTSLVWLLTKLGISKQPFSHFIPGRCSITILPDNLRYVEDESKELARMLGYEYLPDLSIYFPIQNPLKDKRVIKTPEELDLSIEEVDDILFEPDLDFITKWVYSNVR